MFEAKLSCLFKKVAERYNTRNFRELIASSSQNFQFSSLI